METILSQTLRSALDTLEEATTEINIMSEEVLNFLKEREKVSLITRPETLNS